MLNGSNGCGTISPVSLSLAAVLIAIPVPAQFIRILSWPLAALAFSNAAITLSSSVTLASQKIPLISVATASPFSALRSNSAHFTPCFANSLAVASPRPDAPPVITALIFSSNCIIISLLIIFLPNLVLYLFLL